MVKAGNETYVIPLEMVRECAEISSDEMKRVDNNNFINYKDESMPYLSIITKGPGL